MAKYITNSDDITINEVQQTDQINFEINRSNILSDTEVNSTTKAYNCNYSNNYFTQVNNKVNLYKKNLPNGSTITFNGNNRAAYLISTTSNSAGIRGSWLLVTSSGSDTPINLSSSGSNISISSNNGVISIANNGNYGTNCFIVELADDSLNNTNWK